MITGMSTPVLSLVSLVVSCIFVYTLGTKMPDIRKTSSVISLRE